MAVRDALLSLLTAGPAYGFQLHGALESRTGGRRRVNVGQTYATIERATKAGLIESAGATTDGLPLHRLTKAGRGAVDAWLGGADAPGTDPWDETIDRVLVVASLPGLDPTSVIADERARWAARRDEAEAAMNARSTVNEPTGSGTTSAQTELQRLAHRRRHRPGCGSARLARRRGPRCGIRSEDRIRTQRRTAASRASSWPRAPAVQESAIA